MEPKYPFRPFIGPGVTTITGDRNNPFGGTVTSQNTNMVMPDESPEQTIMRLARSGLAVDQIAQLTGIPQDQIAMTVSVMQGQRPRVVERPKGIGIDSLLEDNESQELSEYVEQGGSVSDLIQTTIDPQLDPSSILAEGTILAGLEGMNLDLTEEEAEANLQTFYSQYASEVYEAFLDFYDKGVTDDNKAILSENVDFKDYHLEALPNSHLQLLYSFPFEILSMLEEEGTDDEEEIEPEDVVVEYVATEMATDMIRIRKSLNLYARYEKVYRFTDGATLNFVDGGGLFSLQSYGDAGFFPGTSITSNLLPQLDDFLNNKGFNIAGVGGLGGLFEDKVTFEININSKSVVANIQVLLSKKSEVF